MGEKYWQINKFAVGYFISLTWFEEIGKHLNNLFVHFW